MFIVTLIAADRLGMDDIHMARDLLAAADLPAGEPRWVEEGSAADIACHAPCADPSPIRKALEAKLPGVDTVVQRRDGRRKKLLVADMDSTMIDVECIDELADFAGVKAEVAQITERAMRGELPFEEALRARVALLAGLEESVIDRCRAERVRLTPGAATLVRTMRAHGALTILVTGGFTRFAEPVGAEIGFDRVVANRLVAGTGRLSGTVEAPIVGAAAKRAALIDAAAELGLDRQETLAVGDGANDVAMLEEAGLGVAYRAKPAAAAAADAVIEHGDLTTLLYAQGYARTDWAA